MSTVINNLPLPSPLADRSHKDVIVKPAIVVDFDGTIRHSASGRKFPKGPSDIALYDDVERKLWEHKDLGYLILGVTNQGGVAWGFKTPEQDYEEIEATLALFDRNPFDVVVSCWHDGRGKIYPFNYRSLSRKPGYGMLVLLEREAQIAEHMIDWDNSLMVGDRPEDEACAESANVPFVYAHEFFRRTVEA